MKIAKNSRVKLTFFDVDENEDKFHLNLKREKDGVEDVDLEFLGFIKEKTIEKCLVHILNFYSIYFPEEEESLQEVKIDFEKKHIHVDGLNFVGIGKLEKYYELSYDVMETENIYNKKTYFSYPEEFPIEMSEIIISNLRGDDMDFVENIDLEEVSVLDFNLQGGVSLEKIVPFEIPIYKEQAAAMLKSEESGTALILFRDFASGDKSFCGFYGDHEKALSSIGEFRLVFNILPNLKLIKELELLCKIFESIDLSMEEFESWKENCEVLGSISEKLEELAES